MIMAIEIVREEPAPARIPQRESLSTDADCAERVSGVVQHGDRSAFAVPADRTGDGEHDGVQRGQSAREGRRGEGRALHLRQTGRVEPCDRGAVDEVGHQPAQAVGALINQVLRDVAHVGLQTVVAGLASQDRADLGTMREEAEAGADRAIGDRVHLQVQDYEEGGRDLYDEALRVLEVKNLTSRVDLEKTRNACRERTGLST